MGPNSTWSNFFLPYRTLRFTLSGKLSIIISAGMTRTSTDRILVTSTVALIIVEYRALLYFSLSAL